MSDNVTINILQDNDIVNIVSSQVTEVIDINVAETTEEVTLNITEEIIQVNINKITNSTSTPSLQDVTDVGNHTTNDIFVENNEYYSIIEPYDVGTANNTTGAYTYIGADGIVGIKTNNAEGVIKTTNLSNGLTLEFPDKVGSKTIATTEDIPSISGLVPYTGATSDVDLGEKELTTGKLWLYDAAGGPTEKGSLHYADEALHFENSDGETLMYIEPGFMQLHKTGAIQSNFFTTNLTETRDHYLPNNSGTIALTSNITGINSGTNTGDETATSIKNKLGITILSGTNTGDQDLSGKVDKIIGKGLSTNDYTTAEQTKVSNLSGINTGDETTATIKSKLGITTLSGSNTGDQDLSNLVVKNTAITGATKTKITYDSKGLVTSGADATTADIADSTNKRYVTDANLTTIGNQSGTNTGDETASTIKTKLGITTLSGSNTGDQDLSGYVPTTRTINAKQLNANVTLTTADIADSTGKRYQTENQNSYNDATSSIQTQLNSRFLGIHTLKQLSSGQSTTVSITTASLTTVAGVSNRMSLYPYIPNVSFTCSSLYMNVTVLLASANARILIYSDLNGVPNTKLYESGNLDCSTASIKTTSTGFSFVAGTTYWLCVHSSSTPTFTAYSAGQLMPISAIGTSLYFGYNTTQTFGSAPTNITSPTITNTAPPFIGINF